jgi:putative oxidoreductase
VQRLFSMFPSGVPGIGLLLLRSSVAVALLASAWADRTAISGWMLGAAIVPSAMLCVGFLTPLAALLTLLWHALDLVVGAASSAVVVSAFALDAIALTLLGPGAYSVDARLYGRRVVVLTR